MKLMVFKGNDFVREIWGSRPFVSAGGYNRELAIETSERTGNLIAFGRHYLANVRFSIFLASHS